MKLLNVILKLYCWKFVPENCHCFFILNVFNKVGYLVVKARGGIGIILRCLLV